MADEGEETLLESWVAFLKAVPGAGKAVAHMIGEGGKAGGEWAKVVGMKGKQIQQSIADDTTARSALNKALTVRGVAEIKADPELGSRAVDHYLGRIVRGQVNREAVMAEAIEQLRLDPPKEPTADAPSEDWLNLLGDLVERASSEEMRLHWGRILAGEIRQPGSFSLPTLLAMSIMDRHLAESITKVRSHILDGKTLFLNPFYSADQGLDMINDLVSAGIFAPQIVATVTNANDHFFDMEVHPLVIIFEGPRGSKIDGLAHRLTRVGSELMSIIEARPKVDEIAAIAGSLRRTGITSVWIVEIISEKPKQARPVKGVWPEPTSPERPQG